jgi:hypothetical protein
MNNDWTSWLPARVARIALVAAVVASIGTTLSQGPVPANASPPAAIELADHALASSPALLADESPYELIDPVGPGGITQKQAVGEVTASTMIGGLYNDNGHFGGGYGQFYFMTIPSLGGGLR